MVRLLDEACISPFSDDAVIKKIPLTNFPADMYMVVRALMLLRGLCFTLQLDVQVCLPTLSPPPPPSSQHQCTMTNMDYFCLSHASLISQ